MGPAGRHTPNNLANSSHNAAIGGTYMRRFSTVSSNLYLLQEDANETRRQVKLTHHAYHLVRRISRTCVAQQGG